MSSGKTAWGAEKRSRRLRRGVHPSSLIPHPLKVSAQGVEADLDRFERGREGEAEATLAVLAEDDAGDCGDLRAFEQEVGGGAAVRVDVRHVGECVERAVRRVAREAEF